MKKIVIVVIIVISIFVFSVCSSGDKEVIVKIDVGDVIKGEFYINMKKIVGVSVLI